MHFQMVSLSVFFNKQIGHGKDPVHNIELPAGKNQMDISILVPAIAPDLSKLLLLSPHEAMVTGAKMEIIHRIGDTGTTSKMIQFNLIHSNHILVHELLYTFC